MPSHILNVHAKSSTKEKHDLNMLIVFKYSASSTCLVPGIRIKDLQNVYF